MKTKTGSANQIASEHAAGGFREKKERVGPVTAVFQIV
jgi:hypothetical protein